MSGSSVPQGWQAKGLTLRADGRVGVGMDPGEKLDVQGNVRAAQCVVSRVGVLAVPYHSKDTYQDVRAGGVAHLHSHQTGSGDSRLYTGSALPQGNGPSDVSGVSWDRFRFHWACMVVPDQPQDPGKTYEVDVTLCHRVGPSGQWVSSGPGSSKTLSARGPDGGMSAAVSDRVSAPLDPGGAGVWMGVRVDAVRETSTSADVTQDVAFKLGCATTFVE